MECEEFTRSRCRRLWRCPISQGQELDDKNKHETDFPETDQAMRRTIETNMAPKQIRQHKLLQESREGQWSPCVTFPDPNNNNNPRASSHGLFPSIRVSGCMTP